MQDVIRRLLAELGEDPTREGLLNTPKRVEKAYRFLTSGYDADIDQVLKNSLAVTSAMLGAFRDSARTRMEFLELLKLRSVLPMTREAAQGSLACIADD